MQKDLDGKTVDSKPKPKLKLYTVVFDMNGQEVYDVLGYDEQDAIENAYEGSHAVIHREVQTGKRSFAFTEEANEEDFPKDQLEFTRKWLERRC